MSLERRPSQFWRLACSLVLRHWLLLNRSQQTERYRLLSKRLWSTLIRPCHMQCSLHPPLPDLQIHPSVSTCNTCFSFPVSISTERRVIFTHRRPQPMVTSPLMSIRFRTFISICTNPPSPAAYASCSNKRFVQVYALEIEPYMKEFTTPYLEKAGVSHKVCTLRQLSPQSNCLHSAKPYQKMILRALSTVVQSMVLG